MVHAVGWPGVSHSHFEAWEEIECGAVGEDRPQSGWLARLLAARRAAPSPLSAVAFAETMPLRTEEQERHGGHPLEVAGLGQNQGHLPGRKRTLDHSQRKVKAKTAG